MADGTFEIEYRIFVACRNGCIYQIKGGEVSQHEFVIESKPVGIVKFDKSVVIAGMDNTL